MPSLRNAFTAAAAGTALLVARVQADYYVDPDSVPLSNRQYWCDSEKATCPLICKQITGDVNINTCDPKTLKYGCVCSNGHQPNISEYSLTLPYFVCREWGNQCVADCGSDNACSSDCRENHPCGAQNPDRANATESGAGKTATRTGMATGSATKSGAVVYTGLGGGDGDSRGGDGGDGDDEGRAGGRLEVPGWTALVVVGGSLVAGVAAVL